MEVVNASVWREEVDGIVQGEGLSSHVIGWVEERGLVKLSHFVITEADIGFNRLDCTVKNWL